MGIAFLKSRSEAPEKVIEWVKAAEAFLGVKLAVLQVDNAPEYVKGRLRDWCKENGVTFEKVVPDASPQNGVAERANQTVAAMTRAMLIGAKLSDWFWPLAAQASVHIKNIVPHSTNPPDLTLHHTWHKSKPNLSHLREFGCKVTAKKTNSDTLNKIILRGESGIFVGYARDAKGYLIWFPDAHAVRVRHNVIFHNMPINLSLPQPRENDTLWDDLILDCEARFYDREQSPSHVGQSCPEYAYVSKTTSPIMGPYSNYQIDHRRPRRANKLLERYVRENAEYSDEGGLLINLTDVLLLGPTDAMVSIDDSEASDPETITQAQKSIY